MEQTIVPLRQEVNRHKELYSKERMARLAAQQEISLLKEQMHRLEKLNEDLEREVKTIPAITESNEIFKNDLSQIRMRYKEEKAMMQSQLRSLEASRSEIDTVKGDVRHLAMRLLDIASVSSSNANSSPHKGQVQQQQHQVSISGPGYQSHNGNGNGNPVSSRKGVQYDYGYERDNANQQNGGHIRGISNSNTISNIQSTERAISKKKNSQLKQQASRRPVQMQMQMQQLMGGQIHDPGLDDGNFEGNPYMSGEDDDFDQSMDNISQYSGNGHRGGTLVNSSSGSLVLPRINN